MAWFNGWPWTQFQEHNLDWLIRELKAQGATLANLKEVVEDLKQTVSQDVADILDEMYNDGSLEALISQYMQGAILEYNTFADIPTSGLTVGSTIRTKGFYSIADGGDSIYQVYTANAGLTPANSGYSFKIIGDINPKKAGAYANGSIDDHAVLQALLDTYRRLDLGYYTFLIGQSLKINYDSTRIIGSRAVFKRADNYAHPIIDEDDVKYLHIEGVTFTGGVQSLTSMMVSVTNATDLTIERCKFTGSYGYCLRISNANGANITDCVFSVVTGASGNPGGGVYMQGGSKVILSGLRGDNLLDHLIYLDGSIPITDVEISNCICRDGYVSSALTNAAAIAIYGDVQRVNITNCSFYDLLTGIVIASRSASGTQDPYMGKLITISNCTIRKMTETAIEIVGVSETMSNTYEILIANCSIFDCGQDGIDVRFANMVNISNCNVQTITRNAVAFGSSNGCTISGSNVGNAADGILIGYTGSSDNCMICGCNIYKCSRGVYIYAGGGNSVRSTNYYGGFTNFAFRSLGTNTVCDASGSLYLADRSMIFGSSAPSSGTWRVGDLCFNISASGPIGWKCTVAGSPGTWSALS